MPLASRTVKKNACLVEPGECMFDASSPDKLLNITKLNWRDPQQSAPGTVFLPIHGGVRERQKRFLAPLENIAQKTGGLVDGNRYAQKAPQAPMKSQTHSCVVLYPVTSVVRHQLSVKSHAGRLYSAL
jgi:hypothetical protein